MADFVNPSTLALVGSTPSMPSPWLVVPRDAASVPAVVAKYQPAQRAKVTEAAGHLIYTPQIAAVVQHYRKWVTDHVEEMTTGEKATVDAARAAAAAAAETQAAADGRTALQLGPMATTVPPAGAPTVAYKATDQTAIGTAFADIAGLGQALLANVAYEFEFVLLVDADATTTGIDVACNGPASPSGLNYEQVYWTSATARAERGATAYDANLASSSSNGTATRRFVVRGVVRNGANAGTLHARVKREAVGTGPNVRAGSYSKLWRLN
jgi:hypothetical protein